jgi:excisionase family DNA binding protein
VETIITLPPITPADLFVGSTSDRYTVTLHSVVFFGPPNLAKPSKPEPAKDPNALLTIPAAAAYLSIGPEALRRMCRRKKITFIKVGGGYRFTRAHLEEYVNSRTNRRKSAFK